MAPVSVATVPAEEAPEAAPETPAEPVQKAAPALINAAAGVSVLVLVGLLVVVPVLQARRMRCCQRRDYAAFGEVPEERTYELSVMGEGGMV